MLLDSPVGGLGIGASDGVGDACELIRTKLNETETETERNETKRLAGLLYFMDLVSLGKIEPPEVMEGDWTDPSPLPMRVLALFKWVLLILFQARQDRYRDRGGKKDQHRITLGHVGDLSIHRDGCLVFSLSLL